MNTETKGRNKMTNLTKNNIFVTSDYHFNDNSVLAWNKRPFKSVTEMNEFIINMHNHFVHDGDIVINLGDFCSYNTKPQDVPALINRLNGYHVILPGNNDDCLIQAFRYGYLDKLILSKKLTIIGLASLLHDRNMYIIKSFKLEGHEFVISHYPLNDWHGKSRGAVHYHGHLHNEVAFKYDQAIERYNVSVDATNYRPVNLDAAKCGLDWCWSQKRDITKNQSGFDLSSEYISFNNEIKLNSLFSCN